MDAYRYLVDRLRLSTHQQMRLVLRIRNFVEFVLGRNFEHHLSQDRCHGVVGTHLEEANETGLTFWYCF